ncbi:hypothetical protein BELL_0338g00060 [Botrytis elliptica]|uniref:Uncharacterized protein n=1 Tax=Botrytis elliptica TaxID=278938 RepID=A0A4Z1JXQ0_9HELO|nr:hypothetical protein BELL_0338g00060 [Botrytis elliptica]
MSRCFQSNFSEEELQLTISSISSAQAEFSAVVDCFWDSNYDPYTSFMNILFPISEATEEGYAKAVAESKVRLWSYHEQDPTSHWMSYTSGEDL